MATELVNLSNELAAAAERASASIVAVRGRRGNGSSGIVWRDNLIVTSSEGIRVEEGIHLVLPMDDFLRRACGCGRQPDRFGFDRTVAKLGIRSGRRHNKPDR